VISGAQALEHGLTTDAIAYRLASGRWQVLLPSIYLTTTGSPTRRQRMIAARLYAGEGAAIDGVCACRFHGLKNIPPATETVRVAVRAESRIRSRNLVVVRRSIAPLRVVSTARLDYVEPATAAIIAARGYRTERAALALLAEAVQREMATLDELVRAHREGPPRGRRLADAALLALGAGVLSVSENDFRLIASSRSGLPPVEFNVWLLLPGGRVICVDALFASAGAVHETNGRIAHAAEDLFESMQERHDVMTAAGLIVLHNSPRRLRRQPADVGDEVEACCLRNAGAGLPPGVVRLPGPPWKPRLKINAS
jgi:hypothetical protein